METRSWKMGCRRPKTPERGSGQRRATDPGYIMHSYRPVSPRSPGKTLLKYIDRSAPCLPAHQCVVEGGAGIFRSLHFTYLPDVCLFDDDLPIANLEPGVSGRNSLPLPGTPGSGPLLLSALFMPLDFCIEFCIDFRLDFGPYFGPKFAYFSMFVCINFEASFFV